MGGGMGGKENITIKTERGSRAVVKPKAKPGPMKATSVPMRRFAAMMKRTHHELQQKQLQSRAKRPRIEQQPAPTRVKIEPRSSNSEFTRIYPLFSLISCHACAQILV